jgi:hypothetical protein
MKGVLSEYSTQKWKVTMLFQGLPKFPTLANRKVSEAQWGK